MNTFQNLVVISVLFFSSLLSAHACSRIFWNTNGKDRVVARTMDLFVSDQARLIVYPRGKWREGLPGESNSLKWQSKYASVTVNSLGAATSDGMNEKGLSASLLYLHVTQYEKRDDRPGISYALWVQYLLDNCTTVKEALEAMKSLQVAPVEILHKIWPLHLAMSDASGDSAVIEYIDGRMIVHHGKEFNVMTNEPAYDVQLENLKNYKLFGGDQPIPGDIDPISRFVRASSYLKMLAPPKDDIEAIAGVYGVARTITVPDGAHDTSGKDVEVAWPTLWITIADLTHRDYYFQSTRSPNLFWVELEKLPIAEGDPVLSLNAFDPKLSGNVASQLKPLDK